MLRRRRWRTILMGHISNCTQNRNRRMPKGTCGGVRGRKTKVGRKLLTVQRIAVNVKRLLFVYGYGLCKFSLKKFWLFRLYALYLQCFLWMNVINEVLKKELHIHIRRNCTLWFWRIWISQIQTVSQRQSNGNAPMVYYIHALYVIIYVCVWCGIITHLYTYIYVGLSALYIERRHFLFVTYLIISRYRKAQT